MTILSSTYVGGLPGAAAGTGWSLMNPMAAAVASGQVPGTNPGSVLAGAGYTVNLGAAGQALAGIQPGAGASVAPATFAAAAYNPYASAGINGNWAPTAVGKDPVLYAYYASLGALPALPQPAATNPVNTGVPGLQAVTAGGQTPVAPTTTAAATEDAKQAEDAKKAAAAAPAKKTYTVKSGDTLSGIAGTLGLGSWKTLYEANKGVVGSNPNMIKPGQVLTLP